MHVTDAVILNADRKLVKKDLKINHVYSANKQRKCGLFNQVWNDRMIIWLGESTLQYDSPTIRLGQNYPQITIEKFLDWTGNNGRDVTNETPNDKWRPAT